jgi:hypothetical protein
MQRRKSKSGMLALVPTYYLAWKIIWKCLDHKELSSLKAKGEASRAFPLPQVRANDLRSRQRAGRGFYIRCFFFLETLDGIWSLGLLCAAGALGPIRFIP